MFVFLNSMIVSETDAVVSVYDHGFLYGDGIYETMRAYGGIVFMFEKHMERLVRSASFLRLKLPDRDFIRNAVARTVAANELTDAYIRITVSRGKGPIGLDPDLCAEPTVVVIAEEFREYPAHYYENGMRLVLARTRRNLKDALNPRIKSLNFLNNIMAKMEAKERGGYEAVMLNSEGFLSEGTVSNIFFVSQGALCTPSLDAGILDGITREVVIRIAEGNGITIREGMFYPEDLFSASEVFFTNTTAEIMPVSMVEDVRFDVGELTVTLRELYKQEVEKYIAGAR
jgi:branched-chain amino acid aminotransferase